MFLQAAPRRKSKMKIRMRPKLFLRNKFRRGTMARPMIGAGYTPPTVEAPLQFTNFASSPARDLYNTDTSELQPWDVPVAPELGEYDDGFLGKRKKKKGPAAPRPIIGYTTSGAPIYKKKKRKKKKGLFHNFTTLVKKVAPIAAVGAGIYFGVPALTSMLQKKGVNVRPASTPGAEIESGVPSLQAPEVTDRAFDTALTMLEKEGARAVSPEARAALREEIEGQQREIATTGKLPAVGTVGMGKMTPIVLMGLAATGALVFFARKK